MKSISLQIFLIASTITCFGQTLFFEDLNIATWTSNSEISDSSLKYLKQIPLSKLIFSKDSIDKDVTIWTFRDSVLTIAKYDYHKKSETIVGKYKIQELQGKYDLQIYFRDNLVLKYYVGILSTGNYAILFRAKEKKERNKK